MCVFVTQEGATSCEPLWKPQFLILKLFTLMLASKHVYQSMSMELSTCLQMSFHLNVCVFKTIV